MHSRLSNHVHLKKKCYKEIENIEYTSFKSKGDVTIAEMYYISKHKPKYNEEFKNINVTLDFYVLDDKEWIKLDYKIQIREKEKKTITFLNDYEVESLLNIFQVRYFNSLRNKILIQIILSTGLNVSEVINLKWADVDTENFYIIVNGSKGRKIPISLEILDILNYWKLSQNNKLGYCEFIFCSKTKNTLDAKDITSMIKKYSKKAGIEKDVSCVTLRHTYAINFLKKTNDIKYVQNILGLTSMTSINSYLEILHEKIS